MSDYIPPKETELNGWLTNWITQLDTSGVAIGLSQQQVDQAKVPATNMLQSITDADQAKITYKTKNTLKDSNIADGKQELRAYCNFIKALPNYNDSVGAQFRIVNTPNTPVDYANYKPSVSVELGNGFVRVKYVKKGVEGLNVYSRLSGVAEWTFLALDTHSPYDDKRVLATAGVPEKREYMVIGVLNDTEIGIPSDTVSITFSG